MSSLAPLLSAVFRQYGRRVPGGYELTISDDVLRIMASDRNNELGTITELPQSIDRPGTVFFYSPPPLTIEGVIPEPRTDIVKPEEPDSTKERAEA